MGGPPIAFPTPNLGELLGRGPLMQWRIPPMIRWRYFWGTQGFPGSPVLGVVVLFACAQARYSVPEPRVCGRLRLRRLSEGSQVTFCYKGSTYLLTVRSATAWAERGGLYEHGAAVAQG